MNHEFARLFYCYFQAYETYCIADEEALHNNNPSVRFREFSVYSVLHVTTHQSPAIVILSGAKDLLPATFLGSGAFAMFRLTF